MAQKRGARAAAMTLALLLGVLGAISFVRRLDAPVPSAGVTWVQAAEGPLALEVDPEGAAAQSGVLPGDVLIRVDGAAAPSALDAGNLPWDRADGATLELLRGNEIIRTVLAPTLEGRPEPYGYLALVGVAFLASGVFIRLRWPNVRGGRIYAALAYCLFAQFVLSHTGRADALDWLIYWVDIVAGSLAPALLLHFALTLSRRSMSAGRLAVMLAYLPSACLFAVDVWLSPAGQGGAYRFADPVGAIELRERAETFLLCASVLISMGLLARAHTRTSSTLYRSQIRWLLWGLTAGLAPFVALYAIPFSIAAAPLPRWAAFLSVLPLLIAPATFTAALARYRLYDLNLLLRNGLSEVTAVFFTFAAYAAAREAVHGMEWLSASGARYVGIFAAVLAYPQLRRLVRSGVDRAFYRERYSYRATLLDWARELSAETDLDRLKNRLTDRVKETLDLSDARVWIGDEAGRFDTGEEELLELEPRQLEILERESVIPVNPASIRSFPWVRWLFPMKVENRLRAVLAIADRHAPEEPLSTADRALLGTLCAHASTALEAARLLREVQSRASQIELLHARQEKIVEGTSVGLLMADQENRVQAWNRALEEMFQIDRADAIGRPLGEIFSPKVERSILDTAAKVPSGEQGRLFRYTMVTGRGRRVVVNLGVTLVESGDDRSAVVTFDDISERVKLEEQVLRQERLASLGLLAAGVAHEVNTPLTGISSYAQLLLEDLPGDDPRREQLEKIDRETQRASNIVNSLLNLARPEETAFATLSINETVGEVLQLFEPQVRKRGIKIVTDLDPADGSVRGNRGKLQQVLLNLLLNARDAVGPGGEISIRTIGQGARAAIEVTDDGMGIAEDDLPRIFDPFFTTKGRGKGTGLGLSISYGIVQEHQGELTAESSPGRFTRFRLELPVEASAEAMA